MTIPEALTCCIMGPSGSGKTTLLNLVAGIVKPDCGFISGIAGKSMSYAFQNPRLLPWKTVLENVELAAGSDGGRMKAVQCLDVVELSEFKDAFPESLSGGMAQRVSLARTLAAEGDIVLLDEPFSAIDQALKQRIMARLKSRFRENGTTVIMVTHSAEEASMMADRIFELG